MRDKRTNASTPIFEFGEGERELWIAAGELKIKVRKKEEGVFVEILNYEETNCISECWGLFKEAREPTPRTFYGEFGDGR